MSGGAQVFGNARVLGNAQVFGDARVLGGMETSRLGDLIHVDMWPHSITSAPGWLRVGCKCAPVDWWRTNDGKVFAEKWLPRELRAGYEAIIKAILKYRIERKDTEYAPNT